MYKPGDKTIILGINLLHWVISRRVSCVFRYFWFSKHVIFAFQPLITRHLSDKVPGRKDNNEITKHTWGGEEYFIIWQSNLLFTIKWST